MIYTNLLAARALMAIGDQRAVKPLLDLIKKLEARLLILEREITSDEQKLQENRQEISKMSSQTVRHEYQDQSYIGASSNGGWTYYDEEVYSQEDQNFINKTAAIASELKFRKRPNRDRVLSTIEELKEIHRQLRKDSAMIGGVDEAQITSPGGIDMNEINLNRTNDELLGDGIGIQFNMQGMEPLLNMDIQGFSPVIIDMIPISSVLPLLGLMPTEKGIKYGQEEVQEGLQLSSNK